MNTFKKGDVVTVEAVQAEYKVTGIVERRVVDVESAIERLNDEAEYEQEEGL